MKTAISVLTFASKTSEREFNPMQIVKLLSSYNYRFWSWGTSKYFSVPNRALVLRVNGHRLKQGYVVITLGFDDLFRIDFINKRNRLLATKKGVFVGELFDTIDHQIEFIPEYSH